MVKTRKDIMRLDSLNLEELSGVVSIYPWFAGARLELCKRMAAMGDETWSTDKYALQALYVPSRKKIYEVLKRKTSPKTEPESPSSTTPKQGRQVYVIGGDYFSAEQYAQAKKAEDNIFASFINNAIENSKTTPSTFVESSDSVDFCTEELAKVYLEQGYPDKAKQIYSKLSLLIPEKSVYFASLIEKIDK